MIHSAPASDVCDCGPAAPSRWTVEIGGCDLVPRSQLAGAQAEVERLRSEHEQLRDALSASYRTVLALRSTSTLIDNAESVMRHALKSTGGLPEERPKMVPVFVKTTDGQPMTKEGAEKLAEQLASGE